MNRLTINYLMKLTSTSKEWNHQGQVNYFKLSVSRPSKNKISGKLQAIQWGSILKIDNKWTQTKLARVKIKPTRRKNHHLTLKILKWEITLSSSSNSLCLIESNKIKQEQVTNRFKILTIGIKAHNSSYLLGLIKYCKEQILITKKVLPKLIHSNLNLHNHNKVQMGSSRTNLFLFQTMPIFNLSSFLHNFLNLMRISLSKTFNCHLKDYLTSFSLNPSLSCLFQAL